MLETELAERPERGVPLRVLTTTYMGAADRTALDRLVRDFGAEIRVNHETHSTRLHAKAWLYAICWVLRTPEGRGRSPARPSASATTGVTP